MKMEDPGPEVVKRQRLDHYGDGPPVQRMHEQPPPEPPIPMAMHNYPSSQPLRPPSAYNRPPPPSPYDAAHDPRAMHEHPPQASYDPHRPGYITPNRDRPPPAETNPLHGIRVSSTQSPERPPGVALRPISTAFEHGAPQYGHPSGHEGAEPPQSYPPPPEGPNGVYHGLPLHQGRLEPAHGPPHPPPQAQPPVSGYSEPTVQHGPPYSAGPFPAPHGAVPWVSSRQYPPPPKKGTRAQQACEMCRQRKARCDEGKPTCGYCKENGTQCIYKEMQAPKADRAQKEIMDQLRKSDENYEQLRSVCSSLDEKVDRVERCLTELTSVLVASRKVSEPREQKMESPTLPEDFGQGIAQGSTFPLTKQSRSEFVYNAVNALDTDTIEETSAGVSIHIDHTTGAHRLFKWSLIAKLLEGPRKKINENYVMENEERKGLLRVYGKGQGVDRYDGAQNANASSPSSSASSEDLSRSPSHSSDDDLWGFELGVPSYVEGKFPIDSDHPGGLTVDGKLKLDRQTMTELQNSYLENIHILHPFLDKARLRRMIDKVYRQYNPNDPHGTVQPPTASTFTNHARTLKRKHSGDDATMDMGSNTTPRQTHTEPKLARRVSTAVVLLVMALGKICLHTKPLSGFADDATKDIPASSYATSPATHTLSPTTTVSSPMSIAELRGQSAVNRPPASDTSSQQRRRKADKNVDVIPGLAYFAKAVEILGALQGNDLQYVQANLLAGIYVAQLACVIESWTWIQHACRACYFLVRDPTFSKERDPKRVDLIRFAYLTCLQLESDILAELDLQPSGIHNLDSQNSIQLPKGVVEDAVDIANNNSEASSDILMRFYSFQLSLRKLLNEWQKFFYPPGGSDLLDQKFKPEDDTFSMSDRNTCENILLQFRQYVAQDKRLAWSDRDEPVSDINAARLRGKYYGAKYIVHRPFLYYALHHFDKTQLNDQVMKKFKAYDQRPSNFVLEDRPPASANRQERADWLVLQMLISCRLCVEAAKMSTRAFDGVLKNRRLMVTNIFGTAHAQFGNMLVLAATFTSPHLSWLIEKGDLMSLLNRTINFLDSLSPISTTLATDAYLLGHIRSRLEAPIKGSTDLPPSTSSFGSAVGHQA